MSINQWPCSLAQDNLFTYAAAATPQASATLALERADEVALLFEAAAKALSVDVPSILRQLEPLNTPLEAYHKWISAFRSAAAAAVAAAPTQVRDADGTGEPCTPVTVTFDA